jgi:hypothetical protein
VSQVEERPTVTILNLELSLEVEAGSDEVVFARLFGKHYKAAQQQFAEAEQRRRLSEGDRALGDRDQARLA